MVGRYRALLTELGVIIVSEEDGAVARTFAFDDPVSDYLEIKEGRAPRSCSGLGPYLESLNTAVSTGDDALLGVLNRASVDVQALKGREAEDARASKQQMIISSGLASDARDAISKLRDFAMGLSSSKVTEVSSSSDLHVIQAVNSLDEIDKVANALSSRTKEWYGLHFPELENMVDSIEGYARIVLAGRRDGLTAESFEAAGFPSEKTEMLLVAASNSRGGEITDQSLEMVQTMAGQLISFYDLRRRLEALVEKEMGAVAPNLAAILGTALSARMLARIGSIKKMASLPASTIQVLGAERALFRSLKTGSEPPKHGLLFQHPLVHAAPRWQRGKIARAIAAKAVIAARVDVYSEGGELNKTLLEKLNVRIGEIGEKFREPVERGGGGGAAQRQDYSRRSGGRSGKRNNGGGSRGGGGRQEWSRKRAEVTEGRAARRGGGGRKGSGYGRDDYGSRRWDDNNAGGGYADADDDDDDGNDGGRGYGHGRYHGRGGSNNNSSSRKGGSTKAARRGGSKPAASRFRANKRGRKPADRKKGKRFR
ncbi:MAG: ribonucleotide-diphosphate reductase subunit beta [Thaumarchaeota archaeon]|nr:ribonucleotide-diphosphate reductase subunit beta [Nitrososphaerota archaeon]MDE0265757.1 ribonucleotide-diphosphate reductase subunit beta [Nitrososphaerota archaeon]